MTTALLTVRQAADRLALSPRTFRRRFINSRRIPVIRITERGTRITAEVIDRLIADRTVTP